LIQDSLLHHERRHANPCHGRLEHPSCCASGHTDLARLYVNKPQSLHPVQVISGHLLSASQRRMLVTIAFARIETLGEVLSYLRRTRQGMGGIDSARTRERFLGSENQVYEKALVTAGQAELLDESVGGAAQTAVRGPGSGSTQVRQ